MPYATLTFEAPLNVSCQVGDTAYYVSTTSGGNTDGGFTNQSGNIIEIGSIRQINNATSAAPTMLVDTILGYAELNGQNDKFILFNKNNKANMSSPLGYYAAVKMVNNSSTPAELFSVGMDSFVSSK